MRIDFIASCFVPKHLREAFLNSVGSSDVDVRCQVGIADRKSLDLLISSQSMPLIVIENKIAARFQIHRREPIEHTSADLPEEYDHQLQTYGKWLAAQHMPEGWPGIIALLTHTSLPPRDFEPANLDVYGAVPHVYFWRSLSARLREAVKQNLWSADEPPWMFVGHELCRFLESNDMDATDLEASEIAALNVSMTPARRTTELFAEVGTDLVRRHAGEIIGRKRGSGHEVAHGRTWGWSYFDGEGDIYLAYGIYFYPFAGDFLDLGAAVPPHEQAFIGVGSDKVAISAGQPLPATGWVGVSENWLIIHPIPLSERLTGERLPEFFLRSIDTKMEQIRVLVDQFRKNLPS